MNGRRARVEVVKATGIFVGVRNARLARGTRDHSDGRTGAGFLELSLDSWEAPLVFDVTSVERDARGSSVYRGTLPRAAGSLEQIAIVLVEDTRPTDDAGGKIWHAEVTCSTDKDTPISVLELRGIAD